MKNLFLLEKEIIKEIQGTKYGGMYAGDAFYSFRELFFDKLEGKDDKSATIEILIKLFKDKSNDNDLRCKAAYICTNLDIPHIKERIERDMEDIRNTENYITTVNAGLLNLDIEKQVVDKALEKVHSCNLDRDIDVIRVIYNELVGFNANIRATSLNTDFTRDIDKEAAFFVARFSTIRALQKILKSDKYDDNLKEKISIILEVDKLSKKIEEESA